MTKQAQPADRQAPTETPATPDASRPAPPRQPAQLPARRPTSSDGVPFRGIVLGLLLSAVLYGLIWLVLAWLI